MAKKWRIAGISFEHMHMGDQLRLVHDHPDAEIVGICDEQPERMESAVANFGIPEDRVFTDYRACIEKTQPDAVVLCPSTGGHADWTENVAEYGVHIMVEKPFAASLPDADRMIAAMEGTGKQLAINWPLRWMPAHVTTHRLISEGAIGAVIEVHHYGGNRGPLFHREDKIEQEPTEQEKAESWFYSQEAGGGSLLDYLGYGTTLATWFNGGRRPIEVTCMVDEPKGLEVDEHSVTVARYAEGLSKFETRWGTYTDPWIRQPQPKCGFVVVGREGTISSYDYASTIHLQNAENLDGADIPVDQLERRNADPISYFLDRIERGEPVDGPLSVEISRIGQQIVDTAYESAHAKRTMKLLE